MILRERNASAKSGTDSVPYEHRDGRPEGRQERHEFGQCLICPRHLWPAVHDALQQCCAEFATGKTIQGRDASGHVEILIARSWAGRLRQFGLKEAEPARDPWPRENLESLGGDWRALGDRAGDEEFDRAFRAADRAERAEGRRSRSKPTHSRWVLPGFDEAA